MDGEGDDDDDNDLTEDELAHIVEIYDFPAEFKIEDLLKLFQCFQYVQSSKPLQDLLVLFAFLGTTQEFGPKKCNLSECVIPGLCLEFEIGI